MWVIVMYDEGMTNTQDTAAIVRDYKLARGCKQCQYPTAELRATVEPSVLAQTLDLDHRDPSDKYRTANGKVVHPSDMINKDYALSTVMREVSKCDVLCKNCHAMKSAYEREE